MKSQKTILAILGALTLAALAAVLLTWQWGDYRARLRAMRSHSKQQDALVDTRALETADQLSQLAETHSEKKYAQEAQRLADYSVDAAFAAALQDAAQHPAPLTPETQKIADRLKQMEAAVAADQARIALLNQQVSKVNAKTKNSIQQQLAVTEAQLELDQDELDDAHQDLIRAGGDKQAVIQQQLDQHEAAQKAVAAQPGATAAAAANAGPSVELTKSTSLIAQGQAWMSLDSKQTLLRQAQQNAFDRQAKLAAAHDELEKKVNSEKAQKKAIRKATITAAQGASATPANTATPPVGRTPGTEKSNGSGAAAGRATPQNPVSTVQPPVGGNPNSAEPGHDIGALSFLKDLTVDQKNLSQLDKRIETEQELGKLYGDWIGYVQVRKRAFVHGLFLAAFWICLIAFLVFAANEGAQHFFSGASIERQQLQALRTVILFAVQALGIVLILLVIFGKPTNFATVVALAGAGLTVALKDFIVGFFGWFVLMGKDGIRPGDWVEINGVGGEVQEVGLFHTVLLETGNWTDAAHPTGRKVTFVNSFAIEGHYINFSTSGQWLWDELQVQVPADADPYPTADEIQRIVAEVTKPSEKPPELGPPVAGPAGASGTASTAPSVSVRLEGSGVSILVRYLTRAPERGEVRAKLYKALIELLRQEPSKRGTR